MIWNTLSKSEITNIGFGFLYPKSKSFQQILTPFLYELQQPP
jgi:hypothetical protein